MPAQYKPVKNNQGVYIFTSDAGFEYTYYFVACQLVDKDGNNHLAYSFGFDKSGGFSSNKFAGRFDEKIKRTVISIIKEFFKINGDMALLYFCYPDDEFARHRSITFNKWYNEELSDDINHLKKNAKYNGDMFYGGMLILKRNPFYTLLIDAVDVYLAEMIDQK